MSESLTQNEREGSEYSKFTSGIRYSEHESGKLFRIFRTSSGVMPQSEEKGITRK